MSPATSLKFSGCETRTVTRLANPRHGRGRRLRFLAMGLLLLLALPGCERSADDARHELAALGISWSNENFIESIENTDGVVVKLYLEAGMSANSTSDFGWTPLMHAMLAGESSALIRQLVDAGANVDAKDPGGLTALAIAAGEGHSRSVDLLLRIGAEADAKDVDGWTPLMYAAQVGNERIVRSLIAAGADVNLENDEGDRPLSLAEKSGNKGIVKLLTEAGSTRRGEDRKVGR